MAGHSSFDQDKYKLAEYEADNGSSSGSASRSWLSCGGGSGSGRSARSWCKLCTFFLVFSATLAVIWGLLLGIFFQTLDSRTPRCTSSRSIIGENPGLGFRPAGGLGFKDENGFYKGVSPYSSLIWFRHGGSGNFDILKANLDSFLNQYNPGNFPSQGAHLKKCDFETEQKRPDEYCEFNIEDLSNPSATIKCISSEHYGYYFGKPCILLKLNKVFGWTPEPYDIYEIRNHTTMPLALKDDIEEVWSSKCEGRFEPDACPYLNMAWLHCDGESDPDKENIGPVTYTPKRGFPGYFFPFRNQPGFLSPLVMVQLDNPMPGVLVNLECTVWARNIKHNRLKKDGLTHFELLMD